MNKGTYCILVLLLSGCFTARNGITTQVEAVPHFSGAFLNLGDLDQVPTPFYQERPEYPKRLLKDRIPGEALISFIVDTLGVPIQVQYIKASDLDFAESAVEAVKHWRFKPGIRGGKSTAVMVTVPIQFKPDEYIDGSKDLILSDRDYMTVKDILSRRPNAKYESIMDMIKQRDGLMSVTVKVGSYKAVILYFENNAGQWEEIKSRTKEIDLLIP